MLQEICANMFKMWCLLALADLNTGEFVVWKENELQGSNQSDQDPEIEVPLWNQCNQTRQKETICWERVGSNRCQTGSWSSWSSATLAFHTHFSQPKSSKKRPSVPHFPKLVLWRDSRLDLPLDGGKAQQIRRVCIPVAKSISKLRTANRRKTFRGQRKNMALQTKASDLNCNFSFRKVP